MPNILSLLEEAGSLLVKEMAINLIRKKKNASSSLVKSLHSEVIKTSGGYEVNIIGIDYAKWVNVGRQKGQGSPTRENLKRHGVPIPALIEWITQRGLESGDDEKLALASAIQRSIWQNGIAPTNFIEDSMAKANKTIEAKVLQAMGFEVSTNIDNLIKKHWKDKDGTN